MFNQTLARDVFKPTGIYMAATPEYIVLIIMVNWGKKQFSRLGFSCSRATPIVCIHMCAHTNVHRSNSGPGRCSYLTRTRHSLTTGPPPRHQNRRTTSWPFLHATSLAWPMPHAVLDGGCRRTVADCRMDPQHCPSPLHLEATASSSPHTKMSGIDYRAAAARSYIHWQSPFLECFFFGGGQYAMPSTRCHAPLSDDSDPSRPRVNKLAASPS